MPLLATDDVEAVGVALAGPDAVRKKAPNQDSMKPMLRSAMDRLRSMCAARLQWGVN